MAIASDLCHKFWKKIFFFDLKNSGKFQNGKNLTFFGTYIKYGLRWNEGQDFSHLWNIWRHFIVVFCLKVWKNPFFSRLNFGTLFIGYIKLSQIFSQSSRQISEWNEKIKKREVVDGFRVTGYENPKNATKHRFWSFFGRQIIKIVQNG